MELLELMHNDDIVSENMHCKEVTEIWEVPMQIAQMEAQEGQY
jgi:hypothetical protein